MSAARPRDGDPTPHTHLGLTTLEDETTVDELRSPGAAALARRFAAAHRPGQFEVGEQACATGSTASRCCTASRSTAGGSPTATASWRAAPTAPHGRQGESHTQSSRPTPAARCSSASRPLFAPASEISDNANVNVTKLGERYIAMTETPLPVQFDPATLHAAGVAVSGARRAHDRTPAPRPRHRRDAQLRRQARPAQQLPLLRRRPAGHRAAVIASLPVREPSYMHSFGLTERWLVLAEFPFVVNPLSLALSRPALHRELPLEARAGHALHADRPRHRRGGAGFETDACFAFHHVNAYEEGGEVVVDLAPTTTPASSRTCTSTACARASRYRAPRSPASACARAAVTAGACPRRPRAAADQLRPHNERPYRYVWGNGTAATAGWSDREGRHLAAHPDLSEPDCYPGEPVFVAAPRPTEDDGVLLSVVLDAASGHSFLLVLDAAT